MKMKLKVQYVIAMFLIFTGMVLLFMGFWVKPVGEIHNSVLIAFGEVLTFAGTVIGIVYNCKSKQINMKNDVSTE